MQIGMQQFSTIFILHNIVRILIVSIYLFIDLLHWYWSFQVDKQEKKKKKTGRAKRRIQYNRRFVNVVPTFGKKKGPNANS